MSELKNVTLGARYRDRVTGFVGIATSKTEWLNYCLRVGLMPPAKTEGELAKGESFDVEDLEYVDHGVLDKSLPVFGAPEAKKSKRLGTGGGGRNDMIGDRP